MYAPRALPHTKLPGIAPAQPPVGNLDLVAIVDLLLEHAVLIADSVAHDGELQRRAAVQKAGGEAPKASVAEACVQLLGLDVLQIAGELRRRLQCVLLEAGAEQGIVQAASDEEFHGNIRNLLALAVAVVALGVPPLTDQVIPGGEGKGFMEVAVIAAILVATQGQGEVLAHRVDEGRRSFWWGSGRISHRLFSTIGSVPVCPWPVPGTRPAAPGDGGGAHRHKLLAFAPCPRSTATRCRRAG